ncbi:MAG TPA: LytS/YhcK type 5TM receptor domain-containing protein, partial [Dongiaceae bacterium]|nr:LytS/YhcK type 5TM receptor domain-containing protein [Dongiaceae bacterium]
MPYAAEILLPLAQNISLFVVFAVAFAGVRRRLGRPFVFRTQVVSGVIFGLGAVLAMASPFHVAEGIVIDCRNIIIAVSTAISGPLAGLVCAAIAAFYRWSLGGIGVLPAWAGMVITYGIAGSFWWFHRNKSEMASTARFALLGLTIAAATLPTFLLLPDSGQGLALMERLALPLSLLTPAGTSLAAALIRWKQQREALQVELATAKRRLELALSGGQEGVFDYEVGSELIWTSSRYREMRGYGSAAEISSLAFWRNLVLPKDLPKMENAFSDLEGGRVDRIDLLARTRHCTGRTLHIRSRAVSEKNAAGDVVRIVGSSVDETERVEAETRLRNAIDSMDSGFAYFDAADRLVICNDGYIDPGTAARFGNPVGRTFEQIMRPFAYDRFTAVGAAEDPEGWLRWRTEQHRNPPDRPLVIQWTDGRWFSVLERRTAEGGRVGLWTDITDQKQREIELELSTAQLERQATDLVTLAERLETARSDAVAAKADA